MSVKIEVWGDLACFTRPEMKAERVSYDVITPSAARGIIEAIYWHPGIQYHIDKIYVLNPIQHINIRRNEIKSVIAASTALAALKNNKPMGIYAGEDRTQRASTILKNIHYVIEAHFTITDKAAPGDNPGKFISILTRRLNQGQCYNQPYFGCREYSAYFQEWQGGEIPTIPLTQDLGYMLYDMDFSNPENIKPKFFNAKIVNGVLDIANRKEAAEPA